MGAAASRLLGIEGDEQIGRARWVGGRGRLLVPPKWWLCILTYQVPLWCTVGFLSSPARRHAWVAAGCALCLGAVTGFQVLVCTTDPGIVPRGADTVRELRAVLKPKAGSSDAAGLTPKKKDICVELQDGRYVLYRWCPTCGVHRPPRAAHCDVIDCCVEEYDHFCPVVSGCIGRRTMRYFIGYLASCAGLTAWVGATCYHLVKKHGSQYAVADTAGYNRMCVSAVTGCGAGVWTAVMAIFMLLNICEENTSREKERGLHNPYAHGNSTLTTGLHAVYTALFSKLPPSSLRAYRTRAMEREAVGS